LSLYRPMYGMRFIIKAPRGQSEFAGASPRSSTKGGLLGGCEVTVVVCKALRGGKICQYQEGRGGLDQDFVVKPA